MNVNKKCSCRNRLFTLWSRHEYSSSNPFNEVLGSFIDRRTSVDSIGLIDVWYLSQYLSKLFEILENQTKIQALEDETYLMEVNMLKKIAEKAQKMEKKMKDGLHIQLRNVLKLPDIVVGKILDKLLEQAISCKDLEIVKFEEIKDIEYRRNILKAHVYFSRNVREFCDSLGKKRCCPNIPNMVRDIIETLNSLIENKDLLRPIFTSKNIEQHDDEWKTYFGIEGDSGEDLFIVLEDEDAFGEMFVAKF